jgi:hypothetical protein
MGNALFPKFLGAAFSIVKTPRFNTLIQESASGKELRLALQAMPRWQITLTYEYLHARQRYLSSDAMPDRSALVGNPTDNVSNDWAALAGFFAARRGAYDDFLLDDQDEDPVVDGANGKVGTGDGVTTSFQLVRQLASFTEVIQNVNGTAAQPVLWSASRVNALNDLIQPSRQAIFAQAGRLAGIQSAGWPCYFKCTASGTSGSVEPNWRVAAVAGQALQDGTTIWTNQGVLFAAYLDGTAQPTSAYSLGPTGLLTFTAPPANGQRIEWTGDFYTRVRFARDGLEFEEFYYQFWQAKKVELISVKL